MGRKNKELKHDLKAVIAGLQLGIQESTLSDNQPIIRFLLFRSSFNEIFCIVWCDGLPGILPFATT